MKKASPRLLARLAGGLYLLNILSGAFAIGVVPAVLIVAGDPTASAQNIQANAQLYRLGLAAHTVTVLTNVPLAVIFYDLFRVVDRRLALAVVFFSLMGTAVEASGLVNQFAPLYLPAGGGYPGAGTWLQLRHVTYDIAEVFFGFFALSIAYLIANSTFMPRVIGVLMAIDGLSYLVYSFADILAPGFAEHLVPWSQLPILLGEGSLCLWLLIAGVNAQRWSEQATQ